LRGIHGTRVRRGTIRRSGVGRSAIRATGDGMYVDRRRWCRGRHRCTGRGPASQERKART